MSETRLKQLVGALAVVVVLWLAATMLSRAGDDSMGVAPASVATFFDGVDAASVRTVRIERPSDTIELVSDGQVWRVNGFRADSGSVARLFETLSTAEVGDLAATNPANHDRMGVSADSARTLQIEVGGTTRSLLFGREGPRVATIYARAPDADEVYVVEAGLNAHLSRQLDDWRNRKVAAIDTSRVSRVTVDRDGDRFTLVRADTAWTFEGGGPTRATQVQNLLAQLGGGLVASSIVHDSDTLTARPARSSTLAYSASGEVMAEVTVSAGVGPEGYGDRWGMIAGDSVRYRLPAFRVELIVPTRESLRP